MIFFYSAKRVIAAWRVLMGVWAPKRWDLSLAALSQYTTPPIPTPNLWLDKYKTRPPAASSSTTPVPAPATSQIEEPPVQATPRRRPPSRRIVRHVLRARAEAARALASFFQQLEQAPEGKRVRASAHLAKAYGGWVDEEVKKENDHGANEVVDVYQPPNGWRKAKEVVTFLRNHGAKIANLEHVIEGEWAALSSDADLTPTGEDSDAAGEDIVFVPRSSSS
jgi:glycerol-3-phosphate O-acyltransferase / dihydroxyacetone phosphate acyltransferase